MANFEVTSKNEQQGGRQKRKKKPPEGGEALQRVPIY